MLPKAIEPSVAELLPLIRSFATGDYGIALGGAHAKGTVDEESDLDLYLFATEVRPAPERERLAAFSPGVTDLYCWGEDAPFTQAGTDFAFRGRKVECWLRHTGLIGQAIAECQAGVVRRELVTWTTTGFYNHCALSDVKVMAPLEDPAGIIAGWKAQVATYPPALRRAIIGQHLDAARFWPDNFHYRSAVERADVVYATGIVQQVVHNLVQVLFALNGTYFPGDKKLAEALSHLPKQPPALGERMAFLLWPGVPPTVDVLRRQREELQALFREVDVMAAAADER